MSGSLYRSNLRENNSSNTNRDRVEMQQQHHHHQQSRQSTDLAAATSPIIPQQRCSSRAALVDPQPRCRSSQFWLKNHDGERERERAVTNCG